MSELKRSLSARQEWLNSLKINDTVLFSRKNEKERELLICNIDDRHIFLKDLNKPKSYINFDEVVWIEHGEGPFGELINPPENVNEHCRI